MKNKHFREVEFIKNFFDHDDFIHQPCHFRLNNIGYSPDFYDGKRNIFIEVAGTRQAYHINKEKYELFKQIFPKLQFEIRKTDGSLLDINNPGWSREELRTKKKRKVCVPSSYPYCIKCGRHILNNDNQEISVAYWLSIKKKCNKCTNKDS